MYKLGCHAKSTYFNHRNMLRQNNSRQKSNNKHLFLIGERVSITKIGGWHVLLNLNSLLMNISCEFRCQFANNHSLRGNYSYCLSIVSYLALLSTPNILYNLKLLGRVQALTASSRKEKERHKITVAVPGFAEGGGAHHIGDRPLPMQPLFEKFSMPKRKNWGP